MTSAAIWKSLEAVASRRGISVRKLARRAGLDPTTVDKRKRNRKSRESFPRLDTIGKMLEAADVSFCEFARIVDQQEA